MLENIFYCNRKGYSKNQGWHQCMVSAAELSIHHVLNGFSHSEWSNLQQKRYMLIQTLDPFIRNNYAGIEWLNPDQPDLFALCELIIAPAYHLFAKQHFSPLRLKHPVATDGDIPFYPWGLLRRSYTTGSHIEQHRIPYTNSAKLNPYID
jgi:hypothetical protein